VFLSEAHFSFFGFKQIKPFPHASVSVTSNGNPGIQNPLNSCEICCFLNTTSSLNNRNTGGC